MKFLQQSIQNDGSSLQILHLAMQAFGFGFASVPRLHPTQPNPTGGGGG